MCGICGVITFDQQPVARPVLDSMTGALAHRGPDLQQVRVWDDGSCRIGFGHTRLKIIDLSSAAAQPMVSDDSALTLVFNGEIYNYRELRDSFAGRATFRTSSDTEVILRLYEAEGEAGISRLDGMFAFALWDGRQKRLVLARDRVGKKPLFYSIAPGLLVFASEIKALLRHPQVSGEVDTASLPSFFLYGYVPTPGTLYRGIQKLPPGHLMVVEADGRTRLEEYWDVPATPIPRRVSQADAAAQVRTLVTEAVRKRLVSDVPLGAFLSGGLDSTIIVGVMSQLVTEPVRTFSIGFSGDKRFDETAYARIAAERFGTRHTEFIVEPSAIELAEQLVWHHDGPFADSSAIPTYLLSRLTRQHVTVALNGDGGDELFAGYPRFLAAVMAEQVPTPIRRAANGLLSRLPEWGDHRNLLRSAQKFAGAAALPLTDRLTRWISVFYDDLGRLLPDAGLNGRIPESVQRQRRHLDRCQDATALGRLLYLNMKMYLLDDLLVKMDRCSMAHGLEARSPFLDQALIEYVWTLPDSMKLRRTRTKAVLRQAFGDLVPVQILQRGKMGFGVPLRRWFTTELRGYLHDVLLAPDARLRTYVDQGYVRTLYDDHCAGRMDHAHRLWTLLTFELWLRQLPSWVGPSAVAPSVSSVTEAVA